MTTHVEARPASTVVVLRSVGDAFEVLLVRRNDRVAFMAGAFVFPGGRLDDADRQAGGEFPFLHDPPRFSDLPVTEELAFRHAAMRELQEEASVTVDIGDLLPFAHWVTPAIEIRRYDTRFFLTRVAEGQEARHDEGETTGHEWLTPAEALERGLRGEIMLPPPTWTTLRQLESRATMDEAIEWARRVPIVRVEPGFVNEGDRRILTLPGDPTFPTLAGWEVPVETRFVLQEGRGWLPTRA